MALPSSSLSVVCRSIADFVSQGLHAQENSVRVMIGNPADAVPKESDSDHRINLFFYRLEPFAFNADAGSDETWWLRLHCLVTAFGVLEDSISAGENELRLLGELIRIFHESPVLHAAEVDGEEVELQVVFQPLSTDDINHLWSTQGDVSYRTSVAYEMAVLPVVPSEPRIPDMLVAGTGSQVYADMDERHAPFTSTVSSPPVYYTEVDTRDPAWIPQICFVYQDECAYSLSFERGSDELDDFVPSVWLAGEPGVEVTLHWDRWLSNRGWWTLNRHWDRTVTTKAIDPEAAATAVVYELPLPRRRRAGQAMLYAVREYQAYEDGPTQILRSNPLLVTIYDTD